MNADTQRLEQLYGEMLPSLLGYFRHSCGLAGQAEDLAQDTFLRAWKYRGRLGQANSPRAFLFGIARHVGLDAQRRLRPVGPLLEEPAQEQEGEDPRLENLREAVTTLPEGLRETLLLKLRHELSYAEIAEVLDIPIGTVRSRLHQAVLKLRQSLESTEESL